MAWAELASAALILTLGVTLQTAVGFGMGLFCIPLLVWSGHSLPEAIALLIGAGGLQTMFGTYVLREQVRWRWLLPIFVAASLAMPLGQWLMGLMVGQGQVFVKQAVGAMLLLVLGARSLMRPRPRPQVARGWGYLAGALSGLLTGLIGMGGPPLVLFALCHDWDKDAYRAFLWPLFALSNPLLIGLLALQFGPQLLLDYGIGLALAPCVWLGTRAGMSLSAQWQMRQLQLGATLLLYGIALSSVIGPLLPG